MSWWYRIRRGFGVGMSGGGGDAIGAIGGSSGASTAGQAIGLLLALTKAS